MAGDEEKRVDDDDSGEAKAAKGKPWLKLVLIGLSVVMVVGLSVAGTYFLVSMKYEDVLAASAAASEPGEEAKTEEKQATAPEKKKETAKAEKKKKKKKKKDPKAEAIYMPLEPQFIVNFGGESEQVRFLQTMIEVMARDKKTINAVTKHMPAIRNNIVLLLSSQTYASLSTQKGKEELRAKVLAEVQRILKEQTGEPGVEAVYFTAFVMQ